tara:strand:+ start:262116 stop:263066 length:951 start_codon:yes stop_codon:yes gene_type:complete
MMTDVNDDNEITIEKKPRVGERLRHARETKKLTIADIATELRLTTQTIELIENERWSELHGRAYARGYFSNYVKFLGLPEDELLAAFNIEYAGAEPSLLMVQHHVDISNKKSSWLPYLLFITVVVIAWFAYQKMLNTTEAVLEETSPLLPLTQDNSASVIDESIVSNSQLDVNQLEQRVSPETELLINSESTNDVANNSIEMVLGNELDTAPLQDLAEELSNNDVMPENTAEISEAAMLDLRFSDDCWAQVKDADNKVLLNKLMTKNDSIVLKGRTPFTVTLGRASVTQVRFNDELFDPSAFTQRDVARFTLGAES